MLLWSGGVAATAWCAVVVLGRVLQEGLRGEDTGRVDEESGVGVLFGEGDAQAVDGRGVGEVGRQADGVAVGGQGSRRFIGAGLRAAGDDGAAAGVEDMAGDGVVHAAGAADDDDLLAGEVEGGGGHVVLLFQAGCPDEGRGVSGVAVRRRD